MTGYEPIAVIILLIAIILQSRKNKSQASTNNNAETITKKTGELAVQAVALLQDAVAEMNNK